MVPSPSVLHTRKVKAGAIPFLRRRQIEVTASAAEIKDADGQLIERLEEGESFNLQGLLFERPGITVVLIEDTLLYFFGEEDYQQLRTNHRHFDRFFHSQRSRRIRRAAMREVQTRCCQGTKNVPEFICKQQA